MYVLVQALPGLYRVRAQLLVTLLKTKQTINWSCIHSTLDNLLQGGLPKDITNEYRNSEFHYMSSIADKKYQMYEDKCNAVKDFLFSGDGKFFKDFPTCAKAYLEKGADSEDWHIRCTRVMETVEMLFHTMDFCSEYYMHNKTVRDFWKELICVSHRKHRILASIMAYFATMEKTLPDRTESERAKKRAKMVFEDPVFDKVFDTFL